MWVSRLDGPIYSSSLLNFVYIRVELLSKKKNYNHFLTENPYAYTEASTYGEAAGEEGYQPTEEVEGVAEVGIGSVKKDKDGTEWLITHWCDVCRVGLCSERQLEMHNAGKSHKKKVHRLHLVPHVY